MIHGCYINASTSEFVGTAWAKQDNGYLLDPAVLPEGCLWVDWDGDNPPPIGTHWNGDGWDGWSPETPVEALARMLANQVEINQAQDEALVEIFEMFM